jgi:hypothetical protein
MIYVQNTAKIKIANVTMICSIFLRIYHAVVIFRKPSWKMTANIPTQNRPDRVGDTPLYSGISEFKSWLGDRLSWLKFPDVFFSSSRQITGSHFKLGHYGFLPHPFELTIHLPFYHSTLYSLNSDSVVKKRLTRIEVLLSQSVLSYFSDWTVSTATNV